MTRPTACAPRSVTRIRRSLSSQVSATGAKQRGTMGAHMEPSRVARPKIQRGAFASGPLRSGSREKGATTRFKLTVMRPTFVQRSRGSFSRIKITLWISSLPTSVLSASASYNGNLAKWPMPRQKPSQSLKHTTSYLYYNFIKGLAQPNTSRRNQKQV